jgi:spore cortex biosynthesis protein YabQ
MDIPDTYLSIHEECLLFLWACLMGSALGIVFDGFRAFRLVIPHKGWATAGEDVVFVLLWASAIAGFTSVLGNGVLRFYYILGSILGFCLYRCLLGNPVVRLLRRILQLFLRIFRKILHPVVVLVVRIHEKCRCKFVRNAKNDGKLKNIFPFPLIRMGKMLYNGHNRKRK